jgi:hypothetical protein
MNEIKPTDYDDEVIERLKHILSTIPKGMEMTRYEAEVFESCRTILDYLGKPIGTY